MKIISKFIMLFVLLTWVTACGKSFLEFTPGGQKDDTQAYETVGDLENALAGAYARLGTYEFLGRNAVALGDIAADGFGANLILNSGQFGSIYRYAVSDVTAEVREMWDAGYKAIDNSTRILDAAKVIEKGDLSSKDKTALLNIKAQSHSVRALAAFYLVNIFGLPAPNSTDKSGIVIVRSKVNHGDKISRSSVDACYDWIIEDLKASIDLYKEYQDGGAIEVNFAYLKYYAVESLLSKVYFYKGDYANAYTLANSVVESGQYKIMDPNAFLESWGSLASNSEGIFSLAKNDGDNLSSNALGSLYGDTYGSAAVQQMYDMYTDGKDIRLKLYAKSNPNVYYAVKYPGASGNSSLNNVPILLFPEIIYIAAECIARGEGDGTLAAAAAMAFKVYGERVAESKIVDINITDQDAFISWLADERYREMAQLGNRWYDARRLGLVISRGAGHKTKYANFDVKKFCYPIPQRELTSGSGVTQTPNWSDALPARN